MIAKVLRYSILTIICLVLSLLGIMQIGPVKSFFQNKMISYIKNETGWHLQIEDVDLMLPFEIKITGISAEYNEIAKLDIHRVILRLNPYALIKREFNFHSVVIDEIDVVLKSEKFFKESTSNTIKNQIKTPATFDLPKIFVSVQHFNIKKFILNAKNIKAPVLTLSGRFLYDYNDSIASFDLSLSDYNTPIKKIYLEGLALKQLDHLLIGLEAAKSKNDPFNLLNDTEIKLRFNFSSTENELMQFAQSPFKPNGAHIEGFVKGFFTVYDQNSMPILTTFQTNLVLYQGITAKLNALKAKLPFTTLWGNGTINPNGTIEEANLKFHIPELAKIPINARHLSGSVNGDLSLSGSISNLEAAFLATSDRISSSDFSVEKAHLSGKTLINQHAIKSEIDLTISYLKEEYQTHLTGNWDFHQTVDITSLNVQLPWGSALGHFKGNIKQGPFEGSLKGNITHLSTLGKLIDIPMKGQGDFTINAKQSKDAISKIDIDANFSELSIKDISLMHGNLSASVSNIFDTPTAQISAAARKLKNKAFFVEEVSFNTHYKAYIEAHPFDLKLTYEEIPFNINGTYQMDKQTFSVNIDQLTGIYDQLSTKLTEPFTVKFSDGQILLTPIMLEVGKGSLWVSSDTIENSLHLTVRMNHLPLSLLPTEEFFAQKFDGLISGEAFLFGGKEGLNGTVRVEIQHVVSQEDLEKSLPPLDMFLDMRVEQDALHVTGQVIGAEKVPAEISGHLPISFKLDKDFVFVDRNKEIDLRFVAKGAIAPLLELLVVDASMFKAMGDLTLNIGGTINNPLFMGYAHINNGIFENYELGTLFKDIQATFEGNGSLVKLTSLKATDGYNGHISGSGEVNMVANEQFPFKLNLSLQNSRLVHLDNFDSLFSGSLNLTGTVKKAKIMGNLELSSSVVTIPKKIPEIAESVDVIYINQDQDKPMPTLISSPPYTKLPVELDISLNIKDRLMIRDADLRSQWKGSAKVTGLIKKPQVDGQLNIIDGDYMLNGKQYELSQGRISFSGNIEKKTTLYVSAVRDIQDYKVEIIVKGNIKDPDIILRAQPALNKQQVLSLILFGQVSDQITPAQGEQLEQSLSNLLSDPDSPDTLTKIQKGIGIDNIEFMKGDYGSQEDVSISVGKYLTRNIYFSVQRGLTEDSNSVAIEAKLTKQIKGRIEAGDDSEGQISLNWRYDY